MSRYFSSPPLLACVLTIMLTVVPEQTSAMEFSWKDVHMLKDHTLVMKGEILDGDAEKFRKFLNKDFSKYSEYHTIELTSNGGNLIEALQIAAQLKPIYPTITVVNDCASACFFIYLSGVSRIKHPNGRLGVHRPYFDPKYFAGLSLRKARDQQSLLTKTINAILEENGISKSLIEQMNRTPSSDMYWLSTNEIRDIKSRPAWYEEVLIARCDYAAYLELSNRFWKETKSESEIREVGDKYWERLGTLGKCERQIIAIELVKYAADTKKPKK